MPILTPSLPTAGRIVRHAVALTDEDYANNTDDDTISCESTDGAIHTILLSTPARVDGQMVPITLVRRVGAGVFVVSGVSGGDYVLASAGETLWVKWSGAAAAWMPVNSVAGAGSVVVQPTGNSSLDRTNIQNALDGAAQTVVLGGGTFVMQDEAEVPAGKVLYGANATLLRQPQVATTSTSNFVAGVTTSIVVASTAGLKIGDALGFDAAGTPSNGVTRIAAITGNTLTLTDPVQVNSVSPAVVTVFTTCSLVQLNDDSRVDGILFDGNQANNAIGFWQTTVSAHLGAIVGPGTADRARITNCRVQNEAGEGFVSDGADDVVITNCVFSNIDGNGIHLGGTNRANIIACSFDSTNQRVGVGHADGCISFSNNVTEVVIDGCHFANSPLSGIGGIDSPVNNNVVIANCDFELIVGSPIEGIFPVGEYATDLLISSCTFQACGTFVMNQVGAPTVDSPRRIVVDNCLFEETTARFTRIFDSKFTNNVMVNTDATTAIFTIAGCNNCDFSDNKIIGGLVGIDFSNSAGASTNVRVDRNTIRDQLAAGGTGVRLSAAVAGIVSVSHNTIVNDLVIGAGTLYGIYVSVATGDGIMIDGNTISIAAGSGGTHHGIESTTTTTRSTIINNKIVSAMGGANSRGIRVRGNDRVKNNDIIQPSGGIPLEVVGAGLVPIVQGNTAVRAAGQTALSITTVGSAARVINNQYFGNLVNNGGGTEVEVDNLSLP